MFKRACLSGWTSFWRGRNSFESEQLKKNPYKRGRYLPTEDCYLWWWYRGSCWGYSRRTLRCSATWSTTWTKAIELAGVLKPCQSYRNCQSDHTWISHFQEEQAWFQEDIDVLKVKTLILFVIAWCYHWQTKAVATKAAKDNNWSSQYHHEAMQMPVQQYTTSPNSSRECSLARLRDYFCYSPGGPQCLLSVQTQGGREKLNQSYDGSQTWSCRRWASPRW